MKIITTIVVISCLFAASTAFADKYVKGYHRKDGTYVQGHVKSDADPYRYNNRNSQSKGGSQRDEFSSGTGATNKSNPSYGYRDNDRDGIINPYDRKPNSRRGW